MEDKLRAAFDSVHAEAELKERTLAFLADAGGASPAAGGEDRRGEDTTKEVVLSFLEAEKGCTKKAAITFKPEG